MHHKVQPTARVAAARGSCMGSSTALNFGITTIISATTITTSQAMADGARASPQRWDEPKKWRALLGLSQTRKPSEPVRPSDVPRPSPRPLPLRPSPKPAPSSSSPSPSQRPSNPTTSTGSTIGSTPHAPLPFPPRSPRSLTTRIRPASAGALRQEGLDSGLGIQAFNPVLGPAVSLPSSAIATPTHIPRQRSRPHTSNSAKHPEHHQPSESHAAFGPRLKYSSHNPTPLTASPRTPFGWDVEWNDLAPAIPIASESTDPAERPSPHHSPNPSAQVQSSAISGEVIPRHRLSPRAPLSNQRDRPPSRIRWGTNGIRSTETPDEAQERKPDTPWASVFQLARTGVDGSDPVPALPHNVRNGEVPTRMRARQNGDEKGPASNRLPLRGQPRTSRQSVLASHDAMGFKSNHDRSQASQTSPDSQEEEQRSRTHKISRDRRRSEDTFSRTDDPKGQGKKRSPFSWITDGRDTGSSKPKLSNPPASMSSGAAHAHAPTRHAHMSGSLSCTSSNVSTVSICTASPPRVKSRRSSLGAAVIKDEGRDIPTVSPPHIRSGPEGNPGDPCWNKNVSPAQRQARSGRPVSSAQTHARHAPSMSKALSTGSTKPIISESRGQGERLSANAAVSGMLKRTQLSGTASPEELYAGPYAAPQRYAGSSSTLEQYRRAASLAECMSETSSTPERYAGLASAPRHSRRSEKGDQSARLERETSPSQRITQDNHQTSLPTYVSLGTAFTVSASPSVSSTITPGTVPVPSHTENGSAAPQGPRLTQHPIEVGPSHFRQIRMLGKGDVGRVYLVQSKHSSTLYAMKVLNKKDLIQRDKVRRAVVEQRILLAAHHPFIVRMHHTFQSDDFLYLCLDYALGGEFFSVLQSRDPHTLDEQDAQFYAAEVVLALDYLHTLGVIYRDLKPENLLLSKEGHILLSDFDLSIYAPSQVGFRTNSLVGTEVYLAPEVIRGNSHGAAVDWWALGILIYEMVWACTPFQAATQDETFDSILHADVQFPSSRLGQRGRQMVRALLAKDENNRLGTPCDVFDSGPSRAAKVQAHPWFSGIQWDMLPLLEPPLRPQIKSEELCPPEPGDRPLVPERPRRPDDPFDAFESVTLAHLEEP